MEQARTVAHEGTNEMKRFQVWLRNLIDEPQDVSLAALIERNHDAHVSAERGQSLTRTPAMLDQLRLTQPIPQK